MRKSVQVFLAVALMVVVTAEPAAAALDVGEVLIIQYKDHWANLDVANPYGIEIFVKGTDITSVSVEDPHGGNHVLTNWGGDEWGFEEWNFASLAALDASYGTGPGSYVFTFNAGKGDEDTVAIDYAYTVPTDFATITYPADGDTGVGLNPVYAWDSVDFYANADALGLWVWDVATDDDAWEAVPVSKALTSWQPGALLGLTEYEFEVSVLTTQSAVPTLMQTDVRSDDFDYYGLFDYLNGVGFTTMVPEPVTLGVLLVGGFAMLLGRRRAS